MQQANIGASLKQAQKNARIGTAELAQILGQSRQSVYELRKKQNASIHKVQRLAGVFEMHLVDFLNLGFIDD